MKTKIKYFPILLLMLLTLTSCTKDDGPIDPRTDFEGEYKMEPFQYRYLETYESEVVNDTTLTVDQHPHIVLKIADGYLDKMEMDVRELVEDLVYSSISSFGGSPFIVTVENEHPRLIAITGNEFTMDGTIFNVTISTGQAQIQFRTGISGTGSFSENEINFDFEATIYGDGNAIMTGTPAGTKF